MPSDSENAIDLTSIPCPNTFPYQQRLRNDEISLETTSNTDTAQPRRRLTPRKGRSTQPARRTATANTDPPHDVCSPAQDNQASNRLLYLFTFT